MVSIAESSNYRIFERKRRTGEDLNGPSPCMPHLSVEQTKKTNRLAKKWVGWFYRPAFTFLTFICFIQKRVWRLVLERFTLLRATSVLYVLWGSPSLKISIKTKTHNVLFFVQPLVGRCVVGNDCTLPPTLFTDLSAAGLPAELKHITQRRKRKQP